MANELCVGAPWVFRRLESDEFRVGGVALSPDGRALAIATATEVLVTEPYGLGAVRALPGPLGRFPNAAFNPDGSSLAVSGGGAIKLWSEAAGAWRVVSEGAPDDEQYSAFDGSGRLLAVAQGPTVDVWNLARGERVASMTSETCPVSRLALSPDGTRLATIVFEEPVVRVWDARDGALLHVLHIAEPEARAVAFDPADGTLVTVDDGGVVRAWAEYDTPQTLLTVGDSRPDARANVDLVIAFHPGGRLLAVLSFHPTRGRHAVQLWNVAERRLVATLPMHGPQDWNAGLDFSRDGRYLAAAASDGYVFVWPTVDVADPSMAFSARERVAAAFNALRARGPGWKVCEVPREAFANVAPHEAHEDTLFYPAEAWATAFDGRDELIAPLPMRWVASDHAGAWCAVQAAFAEAGLSPRFELPVEQRAGEITAGRLTLTPEGLARESDLVRIVRAFKALRLAGFVAEASFGATSSACRERVAERTADVASAGAAFWNHQAHQGAFDGAGDLRQGLPVHWEGPEAPIAIAMAATGLTVDLPGDESAAFVLRPAR
jgi:WD40 domain-containing protein